MTGIDSIEVRVDMSHALISLYPTVAWALRGNTYEGLEWPDVETPKPSEQELLDEVARLQKLADDTRYQRQRACEYPDPTLYLDAVVKGDEAQKQAYIDSCLAVKAKYPKPE